MLSKHVSTASILGALLLTSCASNPDRPEIDWQHGAKRGWIAKFYVPETPDVDLPECLAALPKADLARRHFVKVKYRHVRRTVSTIAEVPDALKLKIDAEVELWPADCSHGNFSRISRLLSSGSQ